MSKGTFLYVGGFILPDKNAAAHRVVGIAKVLRELDYSVTFINRTPDVQGSDVWTEKYYYGFKCHETGINSSTKGTLDYLCNINNITKFVNSDVVGIIAYNYPALALSKLKKYCKRKGILCIGDITEWYGVKGRSIGYKIVKSLDTSFRMMFVNKRLSGLVVISDYLENYYKKYLPVVNIPPLVDKNDPKWAFEKKKHEGIWFIYAGSPSSEKERLDIIYNTIKKLSIGHDVKLIIVGITREQFNQIYSINIDSNSDEFAIFLGRIPHEKVIEEVGNADYSILIRDKNLVNTAGFPTKFSESISCGTAVIANDTSSIARYFKFNKNGVIADEKKLYEIINNIIENKMVFPVEREAFHYEKFVNQIKTFLETTHIN